MGKVGLVKGCLTSKVIKSYKLLHLPFTEGMFSRHNKQILI